MSRSLQPVVLAALSLCAAGAAHAQSTASRPWYVGASQAFTRESGVYAGGSDTSSVTSLRGGLDTRLGRGRAFADGTLRHQRYDKNDALNSNGHDLRAGIEWETVGNLSGSLVGASTERLSRLGSTSTGALVPSKENLGDVEARARLGGVGPLAIDGMLGWRELTFSAPERDADEYRQRRASLGVSYRVSGALLVGTGFSGQNNTYPRFLESSPGIFTPDHSRRREVYFTANWVPTAASTVIARLNVGRIEYDINTAADFKGLTGNVTWNWRPTARLQFTTALARDVSSESTFSSLTVPGGGTTTPGTDPGTTPPTSTPGGPTTGIQSQSYSSRVGTLVSVGATYEATAKINVLAGLGYRRNGATATSAAENIGTLSLGARWVPTRTLTFGCDLARESRDGAGADARSFGCFGQVLLN